MVIYSTVTSQPSTKQQYYRKKMELASLFLKGRGTSCGSVEANAVMVTLVLRLVIADSHRAASKLPNKLKVHVP